MKCKVARALFVTTLLIVLVLAHSATVFAGVLQGGPLVIGMTGDPTTVDPHHSNDMWANTMTLNIFDPLIRKVYGTDGKIIFDPSLATSWENIDELTWVVKLREGVKFHNGNAFDAEDVLFSIERYKSSTGGAAGFVQAIDTVKALDDYTVEIKTYTPYAILILDMADIYISDKEYFEKVGIDGANTLPIGTGPYRFVEWIKEDHVTLEANKEYWAGPPSIERVVFRPLKNNSTRVAALLSGEAHIIYNVPANDIDRINKHAKTQVKPWQSPDVMNITIDVCRETTPGIKGKNPFVDKRVREAFALAIDKNAIIEKIYRGHAFPTGQLPIPGALGYTDEVHPYPYDPERAKALLEEAGYPDGFSVVWDVPVQRYLNDGPCSQAIAGYLAKVGINAELNLIPSNQYLSYINAADKTTMYYGASGTGKGDIGYWYNRLFYTRGKKEGASNANRVWYSNPRVDELLDQADATADIGLRRILLEQVTKILHEDYAIIPIYQYESNYGVVKGIDFKPRVDSFIFSVKDITEE